MISRCQLVWTVWGNINSPIYVSKNKGGFGCNIGKNEAFNLGNGSLQEMGLMIHFPIDFITHGVVRIHLT